jgi:phosphatidylserine/phosphatidylglycerophosphate/cardiolipin synthase-like enzyme
MSGRAVRACALGLSMCIASTSGAGAQVGIPYFELVHTTPIDTDLANPDIRDPVTVWCEMIDRARRSIDFEQYYAASKPGEPLETVIAHMEAAAKRGVRIRFLMEKSGLNASDSGTIERLKRIPGLTFRLLDYAAVTGDGIIHAKFFTVDGREAYIGSQNFDWRSLKHIDETGLWISEPSIVRHLGAIFARDWTAQARIAAGGKVSPIGKGTEPPPPVDAPYLVASPSAFDPPGVRDSESELVRLIGSAQREIRIEVMDYAPLDQHRAYYGLIDQAVRAAAQRGVKIKLMVADWNLGRAKLPYLKSLTVLPNVEVRYISIPPAREGFIPFARVVHTKTMDIDDRIAWVGTSNWEGGYFDKSRNVEVVLPSETMAKRIGAFHEQLWSSRYAHRLEATGDYVPPRISDDPPPQP